MQWLLHGSITPAAADALKRHGHQVHDLTEAQLSADTPPQAIFQTAHSRQWDILTSDANLARAPFDLKAAFGRSVVLLNFDGDVEQDDAIDRLFKRYPRLTPGRLYTVTESRVKVRQLPSRPKPSKLESGI